MTGALSTASDRVGDHVNQVAPTAFEMTPWLKCSSGGPYPSAPIRQLVRQCDRILTRVKPRTAS